MSSDNDCMHVAFGDLYQVHTCTNVARIFFTCCTVSVTFVLPNEVTAAAVTGVEKIDILIVVAAQ